MQHVEVGVAMTGWAVPFYLRQETDGAMNYQQITAAERYTLTLLPDAAP